MVSLGEQCNRHRTEILLTLAALLLYAPGIGWGLPQGTAADRVYPWGHDDVTPLGPLAEVRNTLVGSHSAFLGYSLMHYFVDAAAYAPYMAWLWITGGLQQPVATFPYGLRDPQAALAVLTLLARTVTLLMAAGLVAGAYRVGRALWDHTAGLVAAVFTLLLYPMFYYSRTGNFDVPYMFWVVWALVVYAQILREGYTPRRAAWLGVLAACAAGTKDQAASVFLLLPLLLLPLHFLRVWRGVAARPWEEFLRPPVVTVMAGLLAYTVTSGFMFSPQRFLAHVFYITSGLVFPSYEASPAGYLGLGKEVLKWLTASTSGPIFVVCLLAVPLAWMRDRLALGLLLPGVSLLATFTVPVRFVELRYLMPVAFVVVCFAAWPVALGLQAKGVWLRRCSQVLFVLLCVVPALRGLEMTYQMMRDSRYAAAEWLNAHASGGQRIGYFGPDQKLPRVRADLSFVRVVPFVGTLQGVKYLPAQIEEMARGIQASGADFVLVIPDHTVLEGFPYGMTCPNEIVELLQQGKINYQPVAVFKTAPLLPWVSFPGLVDYDVFNPEVQIFARRK